MTPDLSGGLNPDFEYFQPDRPGDPNMRDSSTIWVIEHQGELALPRVTFDAIGESWDTPFVQLNFVHADGRTLRIWEQVAGRLARDGMGKAAIRGAGPLAIQCVEPFHRWTFAFDGVAAQSTTAEERQGIRSTRTMPLAFHIEAEMAAPPWLMGGLATEAAARMQACDASALMGGVRYEQICRVRGTVSFDGKDHPIDGTGMRVRRQGVRNMGGALGHCQHSALFPSGKAFGAIIMAPGPEGPDAFNEAFLFTAEGHKIPARIVEAPWMTHLQDSGDDAGLLIESALGQVRIEGTTLLTMFDHHHFEMAATSILHQGTARYVWDGEETIGLIERCTLRNRIDRG